MRDPTRAPWDTFKVAFGIPSSTCEERLLGMQTLIAANLPHLNYKAQQTLIIGGTHNFDVRILTGK